MGPPLQPLPTLEILAASMGPLSENCSSGPSFYLFHNCMSFFGATDDEGVAHGGLAVWEPTSTIGKLREVWIELNKRRFLDGMGTVTLPWYLCSLFVRKTRVNEPPGDEGSTSFCHSFTSPLGPRFLVWPQTHILPTWSSLRRRTPDCLSLLREWVPKLILFWKTVST